LYLTLRLRQPEEQDILVPLFVVLNYL